MKCVHIPRANSERQKIWDCKAQEDCQRKVLHCRCIGPALILDLGLLARHLNGTCKTHSNQGSGDSLVGIFHRDLLNCRAGLLGFLSIAEGHQENCLKLDLEHPLVEAWRSRDTWKDSITCEASTPITSANPWIMALVTVSFSVIVGSSTVSVRVASTTLDPGSPEFSANVVVAAPPSVVPADVLDVMLVSPVTSPGFVVELTLKSFKTPKMLGWEIDRNRRNSPWVGGVSSCSWSLTPESWNHPQDGKAQGHCT